MNPKPSCQIQSKIPTWDPKKLSKHTNKRSLVDTGCLESLLGLARPLVIGDVRKLSEEVYKKPRIVYSAQTINEFGIFRETRCHFIDANLVMAITNVKRTHFFTCYHLHKSFYHSGCCPGYPQNEDESKRLLLAEKNRLRRKNNTDLRNLRFSSL
jgi:hypothetical protein